MHIDQGDLLDALGDPTRRAVIERLFKGPSPVAELAHNFTVSRPAISHHLKVLKDANLVLDEAVGNQRLYQLNPAGFDLLRDYFDRFWNRALTAFQQKIEQPEENDNDNTIRNVGSSEHKRSGRRRAGVSRIHRRD